VVIWKEFIGLGLYEIIPGFILASLAIYIVSLMGKEPAPSIQQRFETADAEYRAG
jgi:sodium/proline symporter